MIIPHRIAQPRFAQHKAVTQVVVDVLESRKRIDTRRVVIEILLLEGRLFPAVNQVVVPLDVQVARMRAEPSYAKNSGVLMTW